MLFPLDTIAAILLSFEAVDRYRGPTTSPFACVLMVLLGLLVTGLLSLIISHGAGWYLRRSSASSEATHRLGHMVELWFRAMVVGIFWFILWRTQFSVTICDRLGLLESSGLAPRLLGIIPYLLYSMISWIAYFPLHRLTSAHSLSLGRYLIHRAQYSFFILGLAVPSTFIFTLTGHYFPDLLTTQGNPLYELIGLVPVLLILWCFPLFLRYIWGCRPLPPGPLRSRIESLQERSGVRFSQIYLWNLGGGRILNAAAVGFLPPFRYLFLSKALLERMPANEIDAVVCHEMGHVKHKHLIYYLIITMAFMTAYSHWIQVNRMEPQIFWMVGGMALYLRVFFGFLSRRFERQADLTALEVLTTSRPMIEALERISFLSGQPRNAPSWHHGSVAERVAFLRAAELRTEIGSDHHGRVQALLVPLLLAVPCLWAYPYLRPVSTGYRPRQLMGTPSKNDALRHIERVHYLIPDGTETEATP